MTNFSSTAFRASLAVLGLTALAAGSPAHAATLTNVYDTGVLTNNPTTGAPATFNAPGSVDAHYTITTSATLPTAPVAGVGAPAYVLDSNLFPASIYVSNPGALYISPAPTGFGAPNTYYDYRTTFDLTGYDPASAKLTGNYSGDDYLAALYFNGANTGAMGNTGPGSDLNSITPFTFTTQFVAGVNTVDFIFYNSPVPGNNPTALAVGGLTLTANAAPAVPEPGSVAMLIGMGTCGAGFLARRKRQRRAA